jgi:hypothetical protein
MKRLLCSALFILLCAGGALAHDGMIALFADMEATDCDANISKCHSESLYLMYVRGSGPEIANCVEFKLLKSTSGAAFLDPVWSGNSLTIGTIETGISICFEVGNPWCSGSDNVVYIGTIGVANFSDPDTFSVSVVDNPRLDPPAINVAKCELGYPIHRVIGGTFIFNGRCNSPENPYAWNIAVHETTWGALKNLYRRD